MNNNMKFETSYGRGNLNLDNMFLDIGKRSTQLSVSIKDIDRRLYLKFSNECNLNCSYCFQGKEYREPEKHINLNQYRVLLDKLNVEEYDDIVLFGGEPFLDKNINSINIVMEIFINNNFIVYTNGNFSNKIFELIKQHKERFKSILITIDGPEEIHNKRRVNKNENSFNMIINNIENLLCISTCVDIQINVDKENISSISRLLVYLNNLDLLGKCNIILNPVKYSNLSLSDSELYNLYFCLLDKFKEYSIILNTKTFTNFISIMQGLPISLERCNIGKTKVFDFETNKIYTCPQQGCTEVGEFDEKSYFIDMKKMSTYQRIISKDKRECRNCIMKLFCNEGCLFNKNVSHCKESTYNNVNELLNRIPLLFSID
jgi:uncharacterized protein